MTGTALPDFDFTLSRFAMLTVYITYNAFPSIFSPSNFDFSNLWPFLPISQIYGHIYHYVTECSKTWMHILQTQLNIGWAVWCCKQLENHTSRAQSSPDIKLLLMYWLFLLQLFQISDNSNSGECSVLADKDAATFTVLGEHIRLDYTR